MSLAPLDWFILIVLTGGLLRGFMVGAVRQVTSLLGLVLAFFLSIQFMHPVGALIVSNLGLSESVGPIVGFAVLFLGIQLLFVALSRLLEQVLETLSLSVVNRAAGGALGGFKAALLLSVLFLVLSTMEVPKQETQEQSILYTPVASTLPKTLDVASPYLPAPHEAVDQFGNGLQTRVPSAHRTSGVTGPTR